MNCKGNKREAERPGGYFSGIHEVAYGLGVVPKDKEKMGRSRPNQVMFQR